MNATSPLFPVPAVTSLPPTEIAAVKSIAERARGSARDLAPRPLEQRNAALSAIANALEHATDRLLAANAQDLSLADRLVDSGELSEANYARLPLSPAKLAEMATQIRAVRRLPDPLGRILDKIELDTGLDLEKRAVPLGVLAVIFEARPDAVTQIASLALKSGNAVILKPGREVEHTAHALVELIRSAISATEEHAGPNLPADAVQLITGRPAVAELLTLSSLVDLVIPRGSRALVEQIQATTRIPVLGHADGICHVYVDQHADLDQALAVVADSKTDYPAVCNAAETCLIHQAVAPAFLPALLAHLGSKGVSFRGDQPVRDLLHSVIGDHPETLSLEPNDIADPDDWHTEYGDLTLALHIVPSLSAAIDHIHQHGSAHTETICTTDPATAERFLNEVDAASVMLNASTRFADGFRYGLGAEVGVSTSRIHARGPVGLDGLTTTKFILRGKGHLAGSYRGTNARSFTHLRS